MSPMLDIQKRHADVFRVRIGEKGPKGEPRKLTDSLRVTSPSQAVVHAFTDEYGGDVKPWEGQHEAYLPLTELPIMILPGQSVTQWWEKYDSSVCERRCDGETETLTGKACLCPPDIALRMADPTACRPMTRINFICPDVAVVGAGSLVTHGMIAAETLPQAVAVASAALSRGLMVPAYLRVIEHVGKKRRYIVPQLEIVGVSLKTLAYGEANGEVPTSIGFTPKEVEPPKAPAIEPPKAEAPKSQVRRPTRRPPLPGEDDAPAGPDRDRPADEGGEGVRSASGTSPPALAIKAEREALKARLNNLDGTQRAKFKDKFGHPDQLLAKDQGKASDFVAAFEGAES